MEYNILAQKTYKLNIYIIYIPLYGNINIQHKIEI